MIPTHFLLHPSKCSNVQSPAVFFFKDLICTGQLDVCLHACERETGSHLGALRSGGGMHNGGGWLTTLIVWQKGASECERLGKRRVVLWILEHTRTLYTLLYFTLWISSHTDVHCLYSPHQLWFSTPSEQLHEVCVCTHTHSAVWNLLFLVTAFGGEEAESISTGRIKVENAIFFLPVNTFLSLLHVTWVDMMYIW